MQRTRWSPYGIDIPGREHLPHGRDRADAGKGRKSLGISDFCFLVAALAALGGMGLGIFMGLAQDFTLAPAHAHLNLLGWVTMAVYGLYHRATGRTKGAVGWLQALTGAAGAAFMAGGLGIYLAYGHDERFVPLVITGSLLAVLGVVLFLALVIADLLRP